MKKTILSVALIAAITTAKAQKGSLLVYGNLGFTTQKTSADKNSTYAFNPGVGYQFNDHFTVGANFGLTATNDKNLQFSPSYTQDKGTNMSVGPFARYTQSLFGVFCIYGQLNVNYLANKTQTTNFDGATNTSVTTSQTASGFGATLFPAIGVNLKNSFALNFSFGSLQFSSVTANSKATTNFGLTFGNGFVFGISKNFGGKKSN